MRLRSWPFVVAALTLCSEGARAEGGGIPPPSPPSAPNVFTLPITGTLAGQPDSTISLRLGLFDGDAACAWCGIPLYDEMQSVVVRGGRFNAAVGKRAAAGITPAMVVERRSLNVRWALASAPTAWLGSVKISAAPAALTLSPGAMALGESATPTLRVVNTTGHALVAGVGKDNMSAVSVEQLNSTSGQTALRSESTGANGHAVHAVNTTTSSNSTGASVHGGFTSARFINAGGGDIIVGKNSTTGATVFRVANDGRMYSNGVELGREGDPGLPGSNGSNGSPGTSLFNTGSVCHNTDDDNCICPSGSILLLQSDGICSSTQKECSNSLLALCCVCSN